MQFVSIASFFLACKVDDSARPLDTVVRKAWNLACTWSNHLTDDEREKDRDKLNDEV
jgi:hypothetical protein